MIIVNSMDELEDAYINDVVRLCGKPWFDEPSGKWRALADVYSTLAIIELKTTPVPYTTDGKNETARP